MRRRSKLLPRIAAARGRADWHGAEFCRLHAKGEEPLPHGLLVPIVGKVFSDLGVAASLWRNGLWEDMHEQPSLLNFEIEHGEITDRFVYNERCLRKVLRGRVTVLGEHAGFHDFFVPVCTGDRVRAVLVSGPFARARLTAPEILERWRRLTGQQGHPSDPEFSHYLSAARALLVLGTEDRARFQRLLERLASLMAGTGPLARDVADAERVWNALLAVRVEERVWQAAREMVDEQTGNIWIRPARGSALQALGMARPPEHIAVGLFASPERGGDPVEDLLRRDALQRACVEVALQCGDVLSGKIGDHGVTFLSAAAGPARRAREALTELVTATATLARRRFGIALHFGVSSLAAPLPRQYAVALSAAETALSQGISVVTSSGALLEKRSLTGLKRELARLLVERPAELATRFEAYLEAVATSSAYRVEAVRGQLEAGFERMTEGLAEGGAVAARDIATLSTGIDRAAESAGTVGELFEVYRRGVRDLAEAVQHPTTAHHERSLQAAEQYLLLHYTESVRLKDVARIAGFAPNYFCVLFQKAHRSTFRRFLLKLRVQRARSLLAETKFSLERVAQLSGLGRRQQLCRVIKQATGQTPAQYRRRARGAVGLSQRSSKS